MLREGELEQLTKAQADLLEDAAASAIACLDRPIDAHHVGAMYMQVITPALSAMRNELSQNALMKMVRKVGRKVIKWMSHNTGGIGTVKGMLQEQCKLNLALSHSLSPCSLSIADIDHSK